MASTCTLAMSRQQPASCSGRVLPAGRPWPLAAATATPRRRCRQAVRAAASPAEGSSATASTDNDDEDYYYSGDEDGTYYVEKQQPTQKFEFVYMNAEEAAAAEAASVAAFAEGMAEYAALQEWLLFRTWRFGLLFSGYLLLAASGEAAFCELVGSAAGYGYFKLLIADVSGLQPGDHILSVEADKIEQALPRNVAKLFAAYQQALKPRLLVLPGLLAAAAAWNAALPDLQLGSVELGCLVGGFLSYKVALVLKIYADLKPQPMTEEQLLRQQRPMLVPVEDVKLDLREIGRKKAAEAAAAEAAAAGGAAAAAQQPQQRQGQQQ